MGSTGAQAQQSAAQARAAAAAFDAAFAATVPPPVIAANRSLLLSLIATNILGQNTAAIAAAELEYAEMWAQDAGAMYAYAGASAGAAALPPFTTPPQTTNPAGLQAQSAAATQAVATAGAQTQSSLTQLISMVPQALQSMAVSGAAQADPTAILDFLAGPLSPISLFGIGGIPYLLAIQCVLLPMNGANVVSAVNRATGPKPWLEEPKAFPAGALAGTRLAGAPVVSAGLGNGGSIGRLSVPQGWIAQTPTAKAVAAVFPEAGPDAVAAVASESETGLARDLALGSLAGRAMSVTGGAAGRGVGGATGLAAASKPTKPSKATIIVIPPSAED
jgi:PPE-repeat protein